MISLQGDSFITRKKIITSLKGMMVESTLPIALMIILSLLALIMSLFFRCF